MGSQFQGFMSMDSQLLFFSFEEAEIYGGKVWKSKASDLVEATNKKCRKEGATMDTGCCPCTQFLQPGFYYQDIKDIKLWIYEGIDEFIS